MDIYKIELNESGLERTLTSGEPTTYLVRAENVLEARRLAGNHAIAGGLYEDVWRNARYSSVTKLGLSFVDSPEIIMWSTG